MLPDKTAASAEALALDVVHKIHPINREREWWHRARSPVGRRDEQRVQVLYLLNVKWTRTWVEKRREEKVWGLKGQTVWNNFYRCLAILCLLSLFTSILQRGKLQTNVWQCIQGKPPLMRHSKYYRAWRQSTVGERTQWNLLLPSILQ